MIQKTSTFITTCAVTFILIAASVIAQNAISAGAYNTPGTYLAFDCLLVTIFFLLYSADFMTYRAQSFIGTYLMRPFAWLSAVLSVIVLVQAVLTTEVPSIEIYLAISILITIFVLTIDYFKDNRTNGKK